ncbi:Na+/H+ antiporter subunit A, partial [Pseudomonas sp. MPR-R5A]
TFTIAIIGAFSMAGLPPFNGFLSKEMFFTGMLSVLEMDFNWGILIPIIAWIASVFTFIYSMILVFKTFTGKYQPEKLEKKPHEAPIGM